MRVSPRLVDGAAEKCCDAGLDTASHRVRSAVECPLAISAYTIGRPRLLPSWVPHSFWGCALPGCRGHPVVDLALGISTTVLARRLARAWCNSRYRRCARCCGCVCAFCAAGKGYTGTRCPAATPGSRGSIVTREIQCTFQQSPSFCAKRCSSGMAPRRLCSAILVGVPRVRPRL